MIWPLWAVWGTGLIQCFSVLIELLSWCWWWVDMLLIVQWFHFYHIDNKPCVLLCEVCSLRLFSREISKQSLSKGWELVFICVMKYWRRAAFWKKIQLSEWPEVDWCQDFNTVVQCVISQVHRSGIFGCRKKKRLISAKWRPVKTPNHSNKWLATLTNCIPNFRDTLASSFSVFFPSVLCLVFCSL